MTTVAPEAPTCTCAHPQHMHDDWGCFVGVGTSERCGCEVTA